MDLRVYSIGPSPCLSIQLAYRWPSQFVRAAKVHDLMLAFLENQSGDSFLSKMLKFMPKPHPVPQGASLP